MEPVLVALFAFSCGVFVIAAAVFDWNWFFSNWRARFFVNLLGRDGARLFYAGLGVLFFVIAARLY
jgi:hypothetical protein